MENPAFLVRVDCVTFNHSSYINEAMLGMCSQETDFPYVCIIVDDASNDGEPDIIESFLSSFFSLDNSLVSLREETQDYIRIFSRHKCNKNCYFDVFFLKYNHFKAGKSKLPYLSDRHQVKYVAICEGDDYWIDNCKLQKQVSFLESHKNFVMVCHRTKLYSEIRKKIFGENYCYEVSKTVDAKDIINRTGLFISTCSIVCLKSIRDNRPDYWRQCRVSDYPMQIMCAMKGLVYYFNEAMSVYRVENSSSWMGQQKWKSVSMNRLEIIKSEVIMFEGFSNDFPEFKPVFKRKIVDQINRNAPSRSVPKEEHALYLRFFSDYITDYSIRDRIDLWIRRIFPSRLLYYYIRLFKSRYNPHNCLIL